MPAPTGSINSRHTVIQTVVAILSVSVAVVFGVLGVWAAIDPQGVKEWLGYKKPKPSPAPLYSPLPSPSVTINPTPSPSPTVEVPVKIDGSSFSRNLYTELGYKRISDGTSFRLRPLDMALYSDGKIYLKLSIENVGSRPELLSDLYISYTPVVLNQDTINWLWSGWVNFKPGDRKVIGQWSHSINSSSRLARPLGKFYISPAEKGDWGALLDLNPPVKIDGATFPSDAIVRFNSYKLTSSNGTALQIHPEDMALYSNAKMYWKFSVCNTGQEAETLANLYVWYNLPNSQTSIGWHWGGQQMINPGDCANVGEWTDAPDKSFRLGRPLGTLRFSPVLDAVWGSIDLSEKPKPSPQPGSKEDVALPDPQLLKPPPKVIVQPAPTPHSVATSIPILSPTRVYGRQGDWGESSLQGFIMRSGQEIYRIIVPRGGWYNTGFSFKSQDNTRRFVAVYTEGESAQQQPFRIKIAGAEFLSRKVYYRPDYANKSYPALTAGFQLLANWGLPNESQHHLDILNSESLYIQIENEATQDKVPVLVTTITFERTLK